MSGGRQRSAGLSAVTAEQQVLIGLLLPRIGSEGVGRGPPPSDNRASADGRLASGDGCQVWGHWGQCGVTQEVLVWGQETWLRPFPWCSVSLDRRLDSFGSQCLPLCNGAGIVDSIESLTHDEYE